MRLADREQTPALLRAALRGGLRLASFRPVERHAFASEPALLIALALLHLGIAFAVQLAATGLAGQFELEALPRAMWLLPIALACGVACGEAAGERGLALAIAVAAASLAVVLAVPIGLLAVAIQRGALAAVAQTTIAYIWYGFLFWWACAVVVAIARLVHAPMAARLRCLGYAVVLLVAPVYFMPAAPLWSPPYDPSADSAASAGLVSESAFYAQQELLEQALAALEPERPGVVDAYALTAALYAAEDVFMKEVGVIGALLEQRFDAAGRSIRLVNNRATLNDTPIATLTSVRRSLAAIGATMNPAEDVLILYLSSHGSEKHRLSVDLWPLALEEITPAALKQALDDAGIRWRVLVISACYSGGYIEPLRDPASLIITAASATRQSFGCGAESDFTYLAKALFDEELRRTFSFEEAFARAKASIEAREREKGYQPSEPQIHVGAAIREKLEALQARLVQTAAPK